MIIAPYSGTEHLADIIHGVTNTSTPRPSERPVLAFFRGNCGPWENVAKRMRHAMVGALRQGNSSEVDACCLGARALQQPAGSAVACLPMIAVTTHAGGCGHPDWNVNPSSGVADPSLPIFGLPLHTVYRNVLVLVFSPPGTSRLAGPPCRA